MIGPNSKELKYSLPFEFFATNNDAEYEAMITGLGLVAKLGMSLVEVYSDLQFVVGQLVGEFEAKEGKMVAYMMEVRDFQKKIHEHQDN